jgi:hypothetical protein
MHGKVTFFGTLRMGIITSGYGRSPQRHRAHGGRTEYYFLKRATESYFFIVLGLAIILIIVVSVRTL